MRDFLGTQCVLQITNKFKNYFFFAKFVKVIEIQPLNNGVKTLVLIRLVFSLGHRHRPHSLWRLMEQAERILWPHDDVI